MRFTVLGRPQPAGSKRAFVKNGHAVVVDASKKSKPWKQEVAAAAFEARGDDPLLDGPLRVCLTFVMARPKAHLRASGAVKDSAPGCPAVRPDVDKLSRAVLDAMTKVVYRDDAQIVHKVAVKVYGDPERVEVLVLPMGSLPTG